MEYENRIKELREYTGLSQSQLAKLSGFTPPFIAKVEELDQPSEAVFKTIARALSVDIAYFHKNREEIKPNAELVAKVENSNLDVKDSAEIMKFIDFLNYQD